MQPSAELPEPDLFERCRGGDPTALAEAYDRWGDQLYGTALRLLADPAEAEDVVQESFVTLIEKGPTLQVNNLGGWLHRVVSNRCIDRIRRRRPGVDAETAPGLSTLPRRAASSMDLERAVGRLPAGAREVFLLHDVEGFRHREIGELLEISEGTSKSQLFRARRLLRQELHGPDPGDDR